MQIIGNVRVLRPIAKLERIILCQNVSLKIFDCRFIFDFVSEQNLVYRKDILSDYCVFITIL